MAFSTAMYISGDSAPDLSDRSTRLPPLPTSFHNEAYQQLHHPRLAPGFAGEKNSRHRSKHDPMTPDSTAPHLKKRTSRFGLSSLFSRSKSSEAEGQHGKLGTQLEEEEDVGSPMRNDTRVSYAAGRTSFSQEISALPPVEGPSIPLRHRASKAALRSKSSFRRDMSVKTPTAWSPPPLFQAYPQAVKHAILPVPTMSAEAILRLNIAKKKAERQISDAYTPDLNPAKVQKDKKVKRPTTSDSMSKGDWTDKIFVLVTSGYFLQYAGNGAFDRLPEKIMPLSKDSAAFASDAIPGKPYVLQISQVSDDEGKVDIDASRSMFKKLGLRSEMRRSTSSLLLVLENSKDMSRWLVTVRKEIQAMGGKEYNPDEFQRPATGDRPQLQQRPSQRYLIKRDPHRFSEKPSEPPSHVIPHNDLVREEASRETAETPTPATVHRQSMVTSASTESRSLSNTTASIDQTYLDRLRESPRQSYASTDARTVATSRDSSPAPSPMKVIFDAQDQPTAASRETFKPYKTQSPLQQSAVYTPRLRRTSSPAAPNFSVPTFSKRYSSAASSPAPSPATCKAQSPPVTLLHEPSSPPTISEESEANGKRISTLGELQSHRKASRRVSKNSPSPEVLPMLTLPAPSVSHDRLSASESENRFSRRFSSLEYSRGVSPLRLARSSPSPHPPPTAALPAIPGSKASHRASLLPPPTTPLPAVPTAKSKSRYSMMPQPSAAFSAPQVKRPSSSSSADPRRPAALPSLPTSSAHSHSVFTSPPMTGLSAATQVDPSFQVSLIQKPTSHRAKADSKSTRGLIARPTGSQMHSNPITDPTPPPPPPPELKPTRTNKTAFDASRLTPPLTSAPSPLKQTRAPPPPPPRNPSRPQLEFRTSIEVIPHIGREPPPVVSPIERPRSRVSMTSPAESYFDAPAPHPFIPPIRVSDRKFRGSMDGPWNAGYGAPHRTFMDLSAR